MTTVEQIKASVAQRKEECAVLAALWQGLISPFVPTPGQFNVWLDRHDFETVCYGIRETGAKFVRVNGQMDSLYLLKFASKVMLNKEVSV